MTLPDYPEDPLHVLAARAEARDEAIEARRDDLLAELQRIAALSSATGKLRITACDAANRIESLTREIDRLRARVAELEDFAGTQMLRSDFRSADEMRAEIERLRAEVAEFYGALRILPPEEEPR